MRLTRKQDLSLPTVLTHAWNIFLSAVILGGAAYGAFTAFDLFMDWLHVTLLEAL